MPGSEQHAEVYTDALNRAMTKHGINTPQQRAAFLAQLSVESGNLRSTEENLNYSAKRLTQVWKTRFPTIASAEPYAHNPEALANYVYANRLGNGNEASGDGYRYRGRGLIQITGRENYRKVGYENNPDALTDPDIAAHSAAQFWTNRNLNAHSKRRLSRDQFNAISRTINGGNNGSQERWDAYQRGLLVLRP
jgi:putative chitinase